MRLILFIIILLNSSLAWAGDEVFKYDDHGKRDPFWKLINSSGMIMSYETDLLISDIVLEGIISDPSGQNAAVMNGAIVKIGDKIGNFYVQQIDKDRIILWKDGEQFVLKLKKED